MVNNCCVKGCKNTWQPYSNVTYHKFPVRDVERFGKWMSIDQLRDIKVTSTKRICSEHFTPQSFEEYGVLKRLKKDAIPTIFGDTLYKIDDNPTEANDMETHDIKIYLDDICEKQMEVLDEVTKLQEASASNKKDNLSNTGIEKSMHVSIQTSYTYFMDRKKMLHLQKKVRTLQQQLKRRNSRIANMQKIIHHLKKANLNKKDVYKVSRTDLSNWKEHSYCFRIT